MMKEKSGREPRINPEMGFLDHLEELRHRILVALAFVVIFTLAAFLFSDRFIQLLIRPAVQLQPDMKLQVLKVQGMLFLKLWVAFAVGLALSIPVIVHQFWAFVAPGLYPDEKRWAPWLVISVTVFFLVGAIFAYLILVPFALRFLIGLGSAEIEKNISIDFYAKFVMQLILGAGIIFQLPVLSFLLTKMGLITPVFLRKSWRYAVIISMVLAAIITPPDPVSMLMMGIPLLFLYELSIWIAKIAYRKSGEAEEDQPLD
jgi:sec-independent protein translocase protein TatC